MKNDVLMECVLFCCVEYEARKLGTSDAWWGSDFPLFLEAKTTLFVFPGSLNDNRSIVHTFHVLNARIEG